MAAGSGLVIYGLCDPVTLELRYVGKAIDLPSRLRVHRWETRHTQTHKVRWIRSLGSDPTAVILESDPADWEEAERRWIATLRGMGARLTNHAPGGQTSPIEGRHHTDETKAKIRAAALQRGCRPPSRAGAVVSPETRAKFSAACLRRGAKPPDRGGWNKGRKATPDEIEKNRLGHVGRPWSTARRAAQDRK